MILSLILETPTGACERSMHCIFFFHLNLQSFALYHYIDITHTDKTHNRWEGGQEDGRGYSVHVSLFSTESVGSGTYTHMT